MGPTPFYVARAEKKPQKADFAMKQTNICCLDGDIKNIEHDISPLCQGGPEPIFTIFGVWGHTTDVITPVKFHVDRSKGLGAMGTQNRVFPITDFDRRPYNSATHYSATLW